MRWLLAVLIAVALAVALAAALPRDSKLWRKARAINADVHRCLVRCGLLDCARCEEARP